MNDVEGNDMRYLWLHLKQLGLLLCLIMVPDGCSQPLKNHQVRQVRTSSSPIRYHTLPVIHHIELSILDNIKANGFKSDLHINHGLGGLFINWRYGTDPLQTNVNGSGEPRYDFEQQIPVMIR